MHPTSEKLFETKALPLFRNDLCVLEFGPDSMPSTYSSILKRYGIEPDWWFADIGGPLGDHPRRIKMLGEYQIDAPDETYDIVYHGQVLEHVRAPWKFVPETARVLKSGGTMVAIMPAAWEHHACPIDCWRAYPEGLRALFEDAGLQVELAEWFLVDPGNNNGQADSIIIGVKP
jgi:SAM-dependent methyltransferase